MDGRRRRTIQESFDLGLGFIGFFVVAFVGITFFLEITHRDALWTAVTALVLIVFEGGLWLRRRSLLNRPEDSEPS